MRTSAGRRPRASQVLPYQPSLLAAETGGKYGALVACLIGYAQLHGAITLELTGRIPPQLQPAALFDLQMAHVSGSLNAPPPPW
jgi:hypothetical protein